MAGIKWPDLRELKAEIAQLVTDDNKPNGLAVIIKKDSTPTYGMQLIKSGFQCGVSDSSNVIYYRNGTSRFGFSDLTAWFSNFDKASMMAEVNKLPVVVGCGEEMLSHSIIDGSPRGLPKNSSQDRNSPDCRDIDRYKQKNSFEIEASESIVAMRKPFGISHDGTIFISASALDIVTDEEIKEALSSFKKSRAETTEDRIISSASADSNALLIAKGANILETCRWASQRFGNMGLESVQMIIIAVQKLKDGRGESIIKDNKEVLDLFIDNLKKSKNIKAKTNEPLASPIEQSSTQKIKPNNKENHSPSITETAPLF